MRRLARYWKEPHKFMPERFLGDWPKDAFIPFSQGISCPTQDRIHNSLSTLQVPVLVWGDGASCCSVIGCNVLTNFIQILRDRGHSCHDYARVTI